MFDEVKSAVVTSLLVVFAFVDVVSHPLVSIIPWIVFRSEIVVEANAIRNAVCVYIVDERFEGLYQIPVMGVRLADIIEEQHRLWKDVGHLKQLFRQGACDVYDHLGAFKMMSM